MNDMQRQQVGQTLNQVLESFGFLFAETLDPAAGAETVTPGPDWVTVRARYTGPVPGGVCVSAPPLLCQVLAANVLGLDDPADPEAVRLGEDTLKELVNVLNSRLVTDLFGTSDLYDYGIPECVPQPPDAAEYFLFSVDGQPMELRLEREGMTL